MTEPHKARFNALVSEYQQGTRDACAELEIASSERARLFLVPLYLEIVRPVLWQLYQDGFGDGKAATG